MAELMQSKYCKLASFFVFAIFFGLSAFNFVSASTSSGTIDSTNKYAWSNNAGWINFGATNGNISITDSGITGYMWNEIYGWINMAPTNSGVGVSSSGVLSGSAWGENVGWIDFSSANINCSGQFTGTATGSTVGTITFTCTNCNVTTDFRPQSCRGGGEVLPTAYHAACNTSSHKCELVAGSGPNECETVNGWCCDPHGDLNFDGSINLTDFSMLMYYWGQTPPSYKCADINKDGTVDLVDFSIMLYWWTW